MTTKSFIPAGLLCRRVVLQQRSSTLDSWGQQVLTWVDVVTAWALIEPLEGRELVTAQALRAETTHKVTNRYRAGITTAMRIVYQGRIFNILSSLDDAMNHVMLQMLCSEGLNEG